jgi:hypothetical protein
MKRFLYITEISLVLLAVLAAGTVGVMTSSGEGTQRQPLLHKQVLSDQDYDSLLYSGEK